MHKIIGKPTIHPALFFGGKIAGYIIWVMLALHLSGWRINNYESPPFISYFANFTLGFGVVLTVVSLFNLGKSISLGLPSEETELKTQGLYQLNRNPMYVGFNLLTISGALLVSNYWIDLLALFSLIVYHFIILGEEAFLQERFGDEYAEYCKKTRRYL